MIVKLLNSTDSKHIADYSGRKLKAMNARVVFESCPNAPKTIHKYESSDFLTAKARNLGVHLAISPGENDKIDDSLIKNFSTRIAERIGLGDQPWVLFEHTDITRKHYHLQSTRARKDGTVCSSAYLKYRVFTAAKDLCEEMHFSFADPDIAGILVLNKYAKSTGNITVQYQTLLNKVLEEDPVSWQEFQDKMLSRNIKVTKGRKHPHLIFTGLGPDGKPDVSPVYDLDKNGELLERVELCISETRDKISGTLTTSEGVDYIPVAQRVVAAPSVKPAEPEVHAFRTKSEAPQPVITVNRPSSLSITLNAPSVTTETTFDEEPSEPAQVPPEEPDDFMETFPPPTAESVAKKIKKRLREANTWQEFEEKLESDGIIAIPQWDSYNRKWTLGVSAIDFNKRERVDFPDKDIRALLTSGEVRLLCDEHEWSYYLENLSGTRFAYKGFKKTH